MKFFRRFRARVVNFFSRQSDQRLREEMEEHIALQTAENLRAGMPEKEARRQAVLKFGGVGTIREEYHAEQGLPLRRESCHRTFGSHCACWRRRRGFRPIAILTMAIWALVRPRRFSAW
jgi:hypothetical protein